MTLCIRPFQPADLPALQTAMARWTQAAGPCGYCHSGELFNQIHEQFRGRFPLDQVVQIWDDASGIAGLAITCRYESNFVCYAAPQLRASPAERMLLESAYATTLRHLQQTGQAEGVTTDLYGCDVARRALLAALGFVQERVWDWITSRSLAEPLPAALLAPGYTLRSATLADAPQLAAVRNDAFGADWTAEQYRAVMQQPGYDPQRELVVVAPDGTLAALTVVWLDRLNSTGLLEPVATHSAHRRRGLARALLCAALELMRASGMQTAQVEHDASNAPAAALYADLGFTPIETTYGYRRD